MSRRSAADLDADAISFEHTAESDQAFENALAKARDGNRLTVDDAVELLTTGTDSEGIDHERKEAVLELADRRRAEEVGDDVTFVANLNNNVTTACNVGCLFCNFKDTAHQFEADHDADHAGLRKRPPTPGGSSTTRWIWGSRRCVRSRGSTRRSPLTTNTTRSSRGTTSPPARSTTNRPGSTKTDPGTYAEQIDAMSVDGIHVHSITPEEAYHASRGTDRDYESVYRRLREAGLNSAPGTAAEILVEEVRDVICPGKISSTEWIEAMEGAMAAGLDTTATIMYGHVETERHRAMHLKRVRDLRIARVGSGSSSPCRLSTRTRHSTNTALSRAARATPRTS
jgi:FO synthase subunit 2 (EC 2.5.1.-)